MSLHIDPHCFKDLHLIVMLVDLKDLSVILFSLDLPINLLFDSFDLLEESGKRHWLSFDMVVGNVVMLIVVMQSSFHVLVDIVASFDDVRVKLFSFWSQVGISSSQEYDWVWVNLDLELWFVLISIFFFVFLRLLSLWFFIPFAFSFDLNRFLFLFLYQCVKKYTFGVFICSGKTIKYKSSVLAVIIVEPFLN